ncbi:MAG: cobyrinate a,c-diamide synthase [Spirochaetes bacterium]|nr:cobyrinate a,c-diamide synthase [Spirochaetota bacterium]
MKAIVIAGIQSGTGKTTVSMAVMRCLKNRGRNVAPFKTGPDYIDPKFHKFITGNSSYNLDSWMLDENTLKYLFRKNSMNKDIAVAEGVMGLFDGSGTDGTGSTAHLAKILGVPVVLVVNASGMSESAAAMVMGYRDYDRDVDLRGVIFNRVSGESHYSFLKKAVERDTGVKCLGYLAKNEEIKLRSRHLGLIPVEELDELEEQADALSVSAEETIDIDGIEEIAEINDPENNINGICFPEDAGKGLKIGMAMDEAFNFYYMDNLNLMKESGIDVVEFSPLNDEKLPENIDGLYIGGGFPEVFTEKIAANVSMREEIKQKALAGMPVYAECGGLMYLSTGIIPEDGKFYPAVDFFKCKTRMTKRLQRFGYIEVEYNGIITKAHEFHHTVLEDADETDFNYAYSVRNINRGREWKCGLVKRNVLAGYPHIHFYSNPEFYGEIISLFRKGKADR